MGVKEFTLLGTTQCQNVKLDVALSDEMSDLKSDLANLFAITDATGTFSHNEIPT
jgi:hypothetical protein